MACKKEKESKEEELYWMSRKVENEVLLQIVVINSVPLIASLANQFSMNSLLFLTAYLVMTFFLWSSLFVIMERYSSQFEPFTAKLLDLYKSQSSLVRNISRSVSYAAIGYLCYQYVVIRVAVCGYFSVLSIKQSKASRISVVAMGSAADAKSDGNMFSQYDVDGGDECSSTWEDNSYAGDHVPEDDEVALAWFRGEAHLRQRSQAGVGERRRRGWMDGLSHRLVGSSGPTMPASRRRGSRLGLPIVSPPKNRNRHESSASKRGRNRDVSNGRDPVRVRGERDSVAVHRQGAEISPQTRARPREFRADRDQSPTAREHQLQHQQLDVPSSSRGSSKRKLADGPAVVDSPCGELEDRMVGEDGGDAQPRRKRVRDRDVAQYQPSLWEQVVQGYRGLWGGKRRRDTSTDYTAGGVEEADDGSDDMQESEALLAEGAGEQSAGAGGADHGKRGRSDDVNSARVEDSQEVDEELYITGSGVDEASGRAARQKRARMTTNTTASGDEAVSLAVPSSIPAKRSLQKGLVDRFGDTAREGEGDTPRKRTTTASANQQLASPQPSATSARASQSAAEVSNVSAPVPVPRSLQRLVMASSPGASAGGEEGGRRARQRRSHVVSKSRRRESAENALDTSSGAYGAQSFDAEDDIRRSPSSPRRRKAFNGNSPDTEGVMDTPTENDIFNELARNRKMALDAAEKMLRDAVPVKPTDPISTASDLKSTSGGAAGFTGSGSASKPSSTKFSFSSSSAAAPASASGLSFASNSATSESAPAHVAGSTEGLAGAKKTFSFSTPASSSLSIPTPPTEVSAGVSGAGNEDAVKPKQSGFAFNTSSTASVNAATSISGEEARKTSPFSFSAPETSSTAADTPAPPVLHSLKKPPPSPSAPADRKVVEDSSQQRGIAFKNPPPSGLSFGAGPPATETSSDPSASVSAAHSFKFSAASASATPEPTVSTTTAPTFSGFGANDKNKTQAPKQGPFGSTSSGTAAGPAGPPGTSSTGSFSFSQQKPVTTAQPAPSGRPFGSTPSSSAAPAGGSKFGSTAKNSLGGDAFSPSGTSGNSFGGIGGGSGTKTPFGGSSNNGGSSFQSTSGHTFGSGSNSSSANGTLGSGGLPAQSGNTFGTATKNTFGGASSSTAGPSFGSSNSTSKNSFGSGAAVGGGDTFASNASGAKISFGGSSNGGVMGGNTFGGGGSANSKGISAGGKSFGGAVAAADKKGVGNAGGFMKGVGQAVSSGQSGFGGFGGAGIPGQVTSTSTSGFSTGASSGFGGTGGQGGSFLGGASAAMSGVPGAGVSGGNGGGNSFAMGSLSNKSKPGERKKLKAGKNFKKN